MELRTRRWLGVTVEEKRSLDQGLIHTVADIGQPSFAHHTASRPRMAPSNPSGHYWEGLIGALWLPM